MTKYFLTSVTGEKFPALQAERFDHQYDLDLIVNYDDLYQGWAVSELETGGKVVGCYDTKEDAIQALHELVNRIGLDQVFAVREQAKNKVKQLESARQRSQAQA